MHFSICVQYSTVVFTLLLFIHHLCCNIFKLCINPFILIRNEFIHYYHIFIYSIILEPFILIGFWEERKSCSVEM